MKFCYKMLVFRSDEKRNEIQQYRINTEVSRRGLKGYLDTCSMENI